MTTRCDRFLGGTIDVPTDQLLCRPSVYGLILSGEQILLLRYQADPKWTMPGGAVEKGERIENALHREIKEETGIETRIDDFLHFTERFFYYDPACEAWQAYLFYYRCTPLESKPSNHFNVSGDTLSKATWVNICDLHPERNSRQAPYAQSESKARHRASRAPHIGHTRSPKHRLVFYARLHHTVDFRNMGRTPHQHEHPHGHDAGVLSVYRATFPSKADVIAETSDPATSDMLEHLTALGCDTCFDRFDAQKPHCAFGLAGSCCRMCNMGPCRITAKSPVGVCGADADVIVARNLLRWVAAGVAAHAARGREVMLALKAAAEGRLDLPILGEAKIRKTAAALGLADEPDLHKLAGALADVLLEDLGRVVPGSHRTLHALAPAERIETWRKLGILPIGAYQEVAEALHRTSTGTDGNWRTIMDQMLRCGLAFAWSSVVGSSIAMDVLYGTPKRSHMEANLGSLRDGYVNIALHGHSPVLVDAIVSASREPDIEDLATQIGARGLHLYGICCSGLSAMYRRGNVQPLANAMGAELALGTEALDLWVADMQDVYPAIMGVATCVQTPVITTSDSCPLRSHESTLSRSPREDLPSPLARA